ncbi:hypothetical protein MYMA111404_01935 [Mycoplasma marinum]|uniref:Uncharacterized protein n=1 Tax=Mycoplasma marinum TaxID=1937190 RepID=A0A4R0XMY3_9MOLU|nr:hypothetical protein [Mycoplasma marinum]TCG11910.1 hypothetical protein C4B24_00745 [Mycoplasma marinum]
MLEKLQAKFGEKIIKASWEEEAGSKFLRIAVREPNLDKLTLISREISDYLDTIDNSDSEYFLDIASEGTEKNISFEDLGGMQNENISVILKRPIKDKIQFEGELLEKCEDNLTIRWNAKGQFRKQNIHIENIEKINLSAKVKKEKK